MQLWKCYCFKECLVNSYAVCFRKGEAWEFVWLKLVIPRKLALYLHHDMTCLSLGITAKNPNVLLWFYLSLRPLLEVSLSPLILCLTLLTDSIPSWVWDSGRAGHWGGRPGRHQPTSKCALLTLMLLCSAQLSQVFSGGSITTTGMTPALNWKQKRKM